MSDPYACSPILSKGFQLAQRTHVESERNPFAGTQAMFTRVGLTAFQPLREDRAGPRAAQHGKLARELNWNRQTLWAPMCFLEGALFLAGKNRKEHHQFWGSPDLDTSPYLPFQLV